MSLTAYEKFKIKIGGYISQERAARRCWLWHRWGAWSVRRSGDLLVGDFIKGSYLEQQRQCQRCKKVEVTAQKIQII